MRIVSLSSAFQHRGVNLNAWNRRFAVELSGARPRRWKSEVLSISLQAFPSLTTVHHRDFNYSSS